MWSWNNQRRSNRPDNKLFLLFFFFLKNFWMDVFRKQYSNTILKIVLQKWKLIKWTNEHNCILPHSCKTVQSKNNQDQTFVNLHFRQKTEKLQRTTSNSTKWQNITTLSSSIELVLAESLEKKLDGKWEKQGRNIPSGELDDTGAFCLRVVNAAEHGENPTHGGGKARKMRNESGGWDHQDWLFQYL